MGAIAVLVAAAHAGAAYIDLTHEWKLDETSGSLALDAVGGTNGATAGSSSWAAGKINNSFRTTGGTLGYVNSGNVGLTGSFSLSFWVKPEDISQDYRNIVSKHDGASGARSFWIGQGAADGSLRFGMYFDGTNEIALDTGAGALSNNAWSLVSAMWNEATKVQSLYVDGVLRASASRAGQSFAYPRSSNLLFLTNSTSATSGPGTGSWARFSGSLDDVSIWDAPLPVGAIKALHSVPGLPGLESYDAGAFAALMGAYQTNFSTTIGSTRWKRATGLSIGEGATQRLGNGYVMQLDSAGVGVSALSTISLSYDPQNPNLADTNTLNDNPGSAGSDAPAIHILPGGTSEIDGLTSDSSIGSADVRPNGAVDGSDVFVMLWLTDTAGADDRAALRAELSSVGGSVYSLLDSTAPDWMRLATVYGNFDTLVMFEEPTLVGAVNWDFATHADVVVDRIALSTIPEPTAALGLTLAGGWMLSGRRARRIGR